jgi:hypothetical protein
MQRSSKAGLYATMHALDYVYSKTVGSARILYVPVHTKAREMVPFRLKHTSLYITWYEADKYEVKICYCFQFGRRRNLEALKKWMFLHAKQQHNFHCQCCVITIRQDMGWKKKPRTAHDCIVRIKLIIILHYRFLLKVTDVTSFADLCGGKLQQHYMYKYKIKSIRRTHIRTTYNVTYNICFRITDFFFHSYLLYKFFVFSQARSLATAAYITGIMHSDVSTNVLVVSLAFQRIQ